MVNIYIKSYGCQANISDSEAMAGILAKSGHFIVNNENEADLILVNTCSLKNKTVSKELHYIRKQLVNKEVIVGGWLTKKDTCSINKDIQRINVPVIRKNKGTAVIPISQGCLNKCTFCATKLSRGNLISYRIGDIKRVLEKAVLDNCTTIYLTSQDNGCYGFDINTSLPELLKEFVLVKGNYKIRIGMSNQWHVIKILDNLIESYRSDKIMKFLHIPLQTGSDKVLKDMKRIHSVQDFRLILTKFRNKFSDITISTDIIVGYPTETDTDFQKTIDVIQEFQPEVLNISKYSPMPRTFACNLKQIPSEEIKRRSKILTDVYNEYKKRN